MKVQARISDQGLTCIRVVILSVLEASATALHFIPPIQIQDELNFSEGKTL